jgi:nucleotide-binding universal stress UspA family protein
MPLEGEKMMYKRILVPLDGSSRAQCALEVAARAARASQATLVLLQAIGIPSEYSTYMYGAQVIQLPEIGEDVLDAEQAEAESYLATISRSEVLKGIPTKTRALIGAAATIIQDVAREEHADLIILCSHGNTGFKRWAVGSTAQKVSRSSTIPVLVLHEGGITPTNPFPDRLRPLRSLIAQVALDGSDFAEAAIEPAAKLIAALAAPAQGMLLLTHVVPVSTTGKLNESQVEALDEAKSYLRDVVKRYSGLAQSLNLHLETSLATGKNVAETLIHCAETGEEATGKRLTGTCNLMAITTHGRGGLQRMRMGSVTESILGATKLPLLVVHNQQQQ